MEIHFQEIALRPRRCALKSNDETGPHCILLPQIIHTKYQN